MGSKAQINCGNCNEKIAKSGDFALCSGCGCGYHLDKCSIKTQTWKNLGKEGQSCWNCAGCRKKKGSVSNQDEVENSGEEPETFEVSSLGIQKSILAKVDSLLAMKKNLDSIEDSMKFLSSKYDELLKEVVGLRTENGELRKQLQTLQKKESATREIADTVTMELADLDQYGRRMNLEIHGLELKGDHQKEDLEAVLDGLAKDIGVDHRPEYVHQAHRLQPRRDGKPPTVLVQFYSRPVRDEWLLKGRKAKLSGLYFNENLCPYFRSLLKETKTRAKMHNFEFVWFKGGRIMVRRRENDKNILVIRHKDDLKKIE